MQVCGSGWMRVNGYYSRHFLPCSFKRWLWVDPTPASRLPGLWLAAGSGTKQKGPISSTCLRPLLLDPYPLMLSFATLSASDPTYPLIRANAMDYTSLILPPCSHIKNQARTQCLPCPFSPESSVNLCSSLAQYVLSCWKGWRQDLLRIGRNGSMKIKQMFVCCFILLTAWMNLGLYEKDFLTNLEYLEKMFLEWLKISG